MNRRVIKKDTKSLMKRMTGTCLIIILTTVLLFAGCGSNTGSSAAGSTDNQESAEEGGDMENSINNEVINQVSLLQGLTFGDYTGSVTVAELKKMGDIGIETFDKLNGELIMLDGGSIALPVTAV